MRPIAALISMAAVARLLLLCCLPALANDSEAAVIEAEGRWSDANMHHDVGALRRLLAPQFVQISGDGRIISREMALKELSSKPSTGTAYRMSHPVVTVSGRFATLNATYDEVGRGTHGWYRVELHIADVFVFDEGWRGLVGYAHLVKLTHCTSPCGL